jgi:hypothetical protein
MKLSRAAGSMTLDVYFFKKAAFRLLSERYSRENKHMGLLYPTLNRVAQALLPVHIPRLHDQFRYLLALDYNLAVPGQCWCKSNPPIRCAWVGVV